MALYKIPISPTRGTYFDYQGIQITLSILRYNPYMGEDAWVMDISWEEGNKVKTIGGVVLTSGVNTIEQYEAPFPSLLILSGVSTNEDPISIEDINLYIKDNT